MSRLQSLFSFLFSDGDKPKRQVHNQLLIQILAVVAITSSFSLPAVSFVIVFSMCPAAVAPLFVAWLFAIFVYVAIGLVRLRNSRAA
jgi:hypothetical protein